MPSARGLYTIEQSPLMVCVSRLTRADSLWPLDPTRSWYPRIWQNGRLTGDSYVSRFDQQSRCVGTCASAPRLFHRSPPPQPKPSSTCESQNQE